MIAAFRVVRRRLLASGVGLVLAGSAQCASLETAAVPDAVAAHRAALLGSVPASRPLRLQVVLPMRNLAALHGLVHDGITNPASPLYRHYLTVAEFTDRFGPDQADYARTIAFFRDQGLAVTRTYANRYMLQVEGMAGDVARVLGIGLNYYRHPAENRAFMAPDREPDFALTVPVLAIIGLDDYDRPVPKLVHAESGAREGRPHGSGPDGQYLGSDMRAAYYGTGKSATLTGRGQSVGLMELEGYIPSDIPLYFKTFKQKLTVAVNGISVDGTAVDCGNCNDGEQALDIDYAISMAPGLDQVQVYVAQDPVAIEERMASDDTSQTLSTSWGYKERFKIEDPLYQEMAAQGQSWFTASGDASTLRKSGPWPEEDANIIAVGGTDIVTSGPGGMWRAEPGWKYSASGPSLDPTIEIEPYQLPYINTANKGSTKLRNVSDVSANSNTDMVICARGKCVTGYGGTSFASPMWAGFAALANEYAARHSVPRVGFINPTLYGAVQNDATLLHDIVGHRSRRYPAVAGYDLVGGLGSPNGAKTIHALVGK